jgi:hypothetical protein
VQAASSALVLCTIACSAWLASCPEVNEQSKEKAAAKEQPAGVYAEKPNAMGVPRGIKGLTFGMQPAEVRKAIGLPEQAADEHKQELAEIEYVFRYSRMDELRSPAPLRAGSFTHDTTLGPKKALCLFEFAIEARLSRVACQLAPHESLDAHQATLNRVLDTLQRKYGRANKTEGNGQDPYAPVGYGMGKQAWIWQDHAARLELRSEPNRGMLRHARIVVFNASARHLAAVEAIKQKKKRAAQEAEEAKRRKQAEELRRIQRQRQAFDKDL